MAHVYVATKTMELFEECVARDQGSAYRQFLGQVMPTMDDAYRANDGGFRTHLGVSLIGDDCARKLFYGWRWASKPKFSGRTLRLFNRGHLEEARFIALMLASGMQVYQQDGNGEQFRISYIGGHFGSALDGVVIGCPDVPAGLPLLCEMKTHSDKSFKAVKKEGVKAYKPQHYVQMQVYMEAKKLTCGLYLAVNKNDDEIYAEIIPYDDVCAAQYIDRGIKIVMADAPPTKLNESGSFFKCKWCDQAAICHRGALPERNCRTCVHSFARDDGTWQCGIKIAESAHCITDGTEGNLSKADQNAGCDKYKMADYYGA